MNTEQDDDEEDIQVLALVRAQVMTRDAGTLLWCANKISGGLSDVRLCQRRGLDPTPGAYDGAVMSEEGEEPEEEAELQKSSYVILGQRRADNAMVLMCEVDRDLQYFKADPMFHHWLSQHKSYGLVFFASADATIFSQGLRHVLDLINSSQLDVTSISEWQSTMSDATAILPGRSLCSINCDHLHKSFSAVTHVLPSKSKSCKRASNHKTLVKQCLTSHPTDLPCRNTVAYPLCASDIPSTSCELSSESFTLRRDPIDTLKTVSVNRLAAHYSDTYRTEMPASSARIKKQRAQTPPLSPIQSKKLNSSVRFDAATSSCQFRDYINVDVQTGDNKTDDEEENVVMDKNDSNALVEHSLRDSVRRLCVDEECKEHGAGIVNLQSIIKTDPHPIMFSSSRAILNNNNNIAVNTNNNNECYEQALVRESSKGLPYSYVFFGRTDRLSNFNSDTFDPCLKLKSKPRSPYYSYPNLPSSDVCRKEWEEHMKSKDAKQPAVLPPRMMPVSKATNATSRTQLMTTIAELHEPSPISSNGLQKTKLSGWKQTAGLPRTSAVNDLEEIMVTQHLTSSHSRHPAGISDIELDPNFINHPAEANQSFTTNPPLPTKSRRSLKDRIFLSHRFGSGRAGRHGKEHSATASRRRDEAAVQRQNACGKRLSETLANQSPERLVVTTSAPSQSSEEEMLRNVELSITGHVSTSPLVTSLESNHLFFCALCQEKFRKAENYPGSCLEGKDKLAKFLKSGSCDGKAKWLRKHCFPTRSNESGHDEDCDGDDYEEDWCNDAGHAVRTNTGSWKNTAREALLYIMLPCRCCFVPARARHARAVAQHRSGPRHKATQCLVHNT